jgi:hypothetical protein
MTDTEPPVGGCVEDAGKLMEAIDKLDGFKRFTMVILMEIAFVAIVIALVMKGQVAEALAAVTGLLGTMVGYYFGKAATA